METAESVIVSRSGHTVQAATWKGSGWNTTSHIDGVEYDHGTSVCDPGDTAEAEAEYQARALADEIDAGIVVWQDGRWAHVDSLEVR